VRGRPGHGGRLVAGLALVLASGLLVPGGVFAVVATAAGVRLAPSADPLCARRPVYLEIQAAVRDAVERTYRETPVSITFEGFETGRRIGETTACRVVSTVLVPAIERRFVVRYEVAETPEGDLRLVVRDLVHTHRTDRTGA
jgi:hypothetical protein